MEALLFDQKTLSLKYTTDREIPKLELENDVLVEVEYAGICGTDVHIIEVNNIDLYPIFNSKSVYCNYFSFFRPNGFLDSDAS